MKFNELTCVRTLKDFLEHGIKKGDIGVVIIAFTKPNEAYEVEFDDGNVRLKQHSQFCQRIWNNISN